MKLIYHLQHAYPSPIISFWKAKKALCSLCHEKCINEVRASILEKLRDGEMTVREAASETVEMMGFRRDTGQVEALN